MFSQIRLRIRLALSQRFALLPQWTAERAGLLIGALRFKQSYVLQRWEGAQQLAGARRVAVFVHFDRRGRVQPYVLHYLDKLAEVGFVIVFVTNSPALQPASLLDVQARCAIVARRRNVGYDFGGYKDGLAQIGDASSYDEVLFANDSVYGPFGDFSKLLARCDETAAVWGITDSWDRRFHLQSYFLLVKRAALLDRGFTEFWRRLRYLGSRWAVVKYHEVGFTQTLLRSELRCAALFPYRRAVEAISAVNVSGKLAREDIGAERRLYLERLCAAVEQAHPLNATHFFWDYLIGELGCPFLKRDLLLRNPMGIPFVSQWRLLLERTSDYDTDLIVQDLESALRHRSI